ncbi:putative quinol monooxygenase [Dyadobacter subterraneus]|uniref:Antibiotic biosynthesis monooxygenase n=1 Tax=Dyadobacter subterraneus TaxID=2773304 RepID=A0ABR9WHJ5_9BACT|nr:antibiotic biosynthesis monooxygenase family protein [Dyadobacter subterraneus]MBE9464983.1 antibiotic biosynthesis monooxygenase [Dyadobacter subterraneus]
MTIIRIVRMTFLPEKINEFQRIFEQCKNDIRSMPGCLHLELWRDVDNPNIFVTHSHWESVETLEDYKRTEFFGLIWKKTKILFADTPQAFSVEKIS